LKSLAVCVLAERTDGAQKAIVLARMPTRLETILETIASASNPPFSARSFTASRPSRRRAGYCA